MTVIVMMLWMSLLDVMLIVIVPMTSVGMTVIMASMRMAMVLPSVGMAMIVAPV